MTWFIGRSVVVILLAFALGLLVGWLWWRRRRVHFGESQALAKVSAKHQTRIDELTAQLAARDGELAARDEALASRDGEMAARDSELEAKNKALAARDSELADRDEALAARDGQLGARDDLVRAREAQLRERDDEIARLREAATAPPVAGAEAVAGAGAGPAAPPAPASAPRPEDEAPAATAFVTLPDEPSQETLRALATPVEDLRTEGDHTPAIPEQTTAAAAPESLTMGEGDDLERVEGIGPRIGAALRGAGIHTFAQLAEAEIATLQGALEQAGLRFAPSLPTWGRQAQLLADGDEAGFQALTQQLVGGRDISGTN